MEYLKYLNFILYFQTLFVTWKHKEDINHLICLKMYVNCLKSNNSSYLLKFATLLIKRVLNVNVKKRIMKIFKIFLKYITFLQHFIFNKN